MTDGGDLSVGTGAAIAGGYGLSAAIDDNTAIYATDDTPTAESRYRARFYFDPNSIAMVNGNAHYILYGYAGESTIVIRVELRSYNGDYQVRADTLNDGTSRPATPWFTISDGPHAIELDWQAASAAGANNGSFGLWIDGVQVGSITAIDNDTRRIDRVRLGPVAGIDSGTRGVYYFDAFESRRNTQIGADPSAVIPTPTPATDQIFTDGFETVNFTRWSTSATDGGDLSASPIAGLVDSTGMQALLDDNTAIYVTDWTPWRERQYRARFYIDPNSLPMGASDNHVVFYGYSYAGGADATVLRIEFGKVTGGYRIRAGAIDDATAWRNTAWVSISDAAHVIEVNWLAASGTGTNDGLLTLWVDGGSPLSVTALDNDTRRIDYVRLGAVAGIDAGTRGAYFFDAFESRRGSYIGGTATPTLTPTP